MPRSPHSDEAQVAVHEHFMRLALQEAELAFQEDEVPVGAVIVQAGHVIAAGHNRRIQARDPTAHAEIVAITRAATAIGDWRLEQCTLYVTLEPCVMCAGAILQARIPIIAYGALDPKAGAVDSLYRLLDDSRLNHRVQVLPQVLSHSCGDLLSRFFRAKRQLGKK